jgi:chemotaxis protein methyltransferase CheR
MDKYLIAEGEGYVVRRRTAALVEPRHLNLNDRMALRAMRGFDFIFCRNVLIYFDDLSRKSVVDHFYNALNPGGYIFLGHSESIGRVTTAFKLKRFENHLVYVKE